MESQTGRLPANLTVMTMIPRFRLFVLRTASWGIVVTVLVSVGCQHVIDPTLPANAARLTPPLVYERWWAMVEECAGVTAQLEMVEWYYVPNVNTVSDGQRMTVGYWSPSNNRIVLPGNEVFDGAVVRHEMLHAILRTPRHPRAPFLTTCGGIAACEITPGCIQDAGPPPIVNEGTPSVPPSALRVTSTITPLQPASSIDGGFFTYTIFVQNPADHAVVATLGPHPGATPVAYPYAVRSATRAYLSEILALDPSMTYFTAGETKQQVFDFAIGPSGSAPFSNVFGRGNRGIALPYGTYTFQGGFGDNPAPDISVDLHQ